MLKDVKREERNDKGRRDNLSRVSLQSWTRFHSVDHH